MGHRHLFNASPMFDSEQDQNWNHMHVEQPFPNLAGRAGPAENGTFFYPAENMPVDAVHFTPQWNPSSLSNGYISSSHSVEVSHYQPDTSGPSHDPFLHSSTSGIFCEVPENHTQHASSSNYERQTFHSIEGGLVDLSMGNVRGPHKRKSPGVPPICEGGSTSRYYGAGSSSGSPISPELRQDKPNLDPQFMAWDCFNTSGHRGNLSIRPEGAVRNVRSRPALDLESNLARTHLSSNSSNNPYPASHPFDHSSSMDFSGQGSHALSHDWSHARMSPASGRMLVSDASGYNHEANHFLAGSSMTNGSVDGRGYPHDFISNRNPVVPQSFHSASSHSVRGVRSSYAQRPSPTFRASSSALRLGHVAPSDDGIQLVGETFSSRQPRLSTSMPWRTSDRTGRSGVSYDRYRSLSNEPGLHDRFASEGYMVVDRSTFYGPRSVFDQHRDMRLDVDNMTYEELLALGERIGCVSTGLSEDLISKSLTETLYCSSGQSQDEENCAICLEEYKDMDDVGSLKICGHDYHVKCIKKWLSMKNACPICKASAVADNMKE